MLPCLQTFQLAVSGHQQTSFVGGMFLLLARSALTLGSVASELYVH